MCAESLNRKSHIEQCNRGKGLPDSLEQDDLLVGQIFEERFQILAVLGKGGGGVVYKAKHTHMDKLVAIKMLVSSLVHDEESFLRFKQEAKAAAALEHQNIITIHDFGKSFDGQAYLVMEFISGKSLDNLFKTESRLDIDRFVSIFGEFVTACITLTRRESYIGISSRAT